MDSLWKHGLTTSENRIAHAFDFDGDTDEQDFFSLLLIRRTEELILDLFAGGHVSGTTHTCIGQEAVAVGVIGSLDRERDYVFSNHRNHGHFLAFGGALEGLIREVEGKETGVSGGQGGSQHIKGKRFFASGIQGGAVPVACGVAMGGSLAGNDSVVTVCLGDGTMGQGVVYESLNLASLWDLPVFFLVENNRYAQSTPTEDSVAGSLLERGRCFGIAADEIESTDVHELREWGRTAIETVRGSRRPFWGVVHTYRLGPHSKDDDFRDPLEIEKFQARDPIRVQAARITEAARRRSEDAVDRSLAEFRESTQSNAGS